MGFRQIFTHWTYETFPPGAILRTKYNAFRRLMDIDEDCLHLIASLEAIHTGAIHVDPSRISQLTTALDMQLREMLEQLQHINPRRFMDLMDYVSKISFYMRMATSIPDPDITPPFIFPLSAATNYALHANASSLALATVMQTSEIPIPPGFVISSSAYHYFIETNNLRSTINSLLCSLNIALPQQLASIANQIQECIRTAHVPEAVANAIEIAASEIMHKGRSLELYADPRTSRNIALNKHHARLSELTPSGVVQAWKDSILLKYHPAAIKERIQQCLADSEIPMVAMVFSVPPYKTVGEHQPSDTYEPASTTTPPEPTDITAHNTKKMTTYELEIKHILGRSQAITWMLDTRNRIWITGILPAHPPVTSAKKQLDGGMPFIAQRTLPSSGSATMLLPEKSRSMYDMICFAREKGVEEMFALVNRSGLGLEGAKTLIWPPVYLNILNLADGFFPTAAGRSTIGPNEIKSIPMWAVWFGLESVLNPAEEEITENWNMDNPRLKGHAILSRTYLHLMIHFGQDFAEIDTVCGADKTKNHIFFRFREENTGDHAHKIAKMVEILKDQDVELNVQGNMLEVSHQGKGETVIQKKLAMLGILLGRSDLKNPSTP